MFLSLYKTQWVLCIKPPAAKGLVLWKPYFFHGFYKAKKYVKGIS